MAARQPARASPELRKAPLSPRYPRNYTTPWGTTASLKAAATELCVTQSAVSHQVRGL